MPSKLTRFLGLVEDIKDFQYVDAQTIKLPASKILIDGVLYSAGDLNFSFANGTGDNGLDTGVEAQDQWYALYAVPKAGTSNYVLKASVNPPIAAGGSGPTGFSKHRYLGVFRNGGNHYDTVSPYARGDITKFVKSGRRIAWQTFNSNNGGAYPAAPGVMGIMLYVANTSVNGIMMDLSNAGNFGFAGFNVSGGGVKIPYRYADYLYEMGINAGSGTCYAWLTDSSNNNRLYIPLSNVTTIFKGEFNFKYSETDPNWITRIHANHSGNSNVSRTLAINAMIDPHIEYFGGNG